MSGNTKGVCPVCGAPQNRETRPFCSRRCADVDLHRWLTGQYAIPVVEEDGGEPDDREEDSPVGADGHDGRHG